MSINRRKFIKKGAILLPALSINASSLFAINKKPFKRIRPGDAMWPSAEKWKELSKAVNGNLIKIESAVAGCKNSLNAPLGLVS